MGLSNSKLGEQQFTVETYVNEKRIGHVEVADPFAHTTVRLRGWGHAWRALFGGIKVVVRVSGTHGAMRAVMSLDPEQMRRDSEEFLREMAARRESNAAQGIVGFYKEP